MNNSLWVNFENEIQKIKDYLNYIHSVDKIIIYPTNKNDSQETQQLLKNLKESHQKFKVERKIFEYKAVVISLYGLLEKYVEVWIKEYLDKVSENFPYNNLSDKLCETHFSLSMKLMSLVVENRRAKYELLQKEIILEKLNNCVKNPENYNFNTEAFTMQSGNLKHARIIEIFQNIDINLYDYLIKNDEISISGNIQHGKIDELVERRNEIAHGAEIENLLDKSILEEYIDFVKIYSKALFETLNKVLQENLLKKKVELHFFPIETVHDVINNSILTFALQNYTINLNDCLIFQDKKGKFYESKILSIQKDSKPHSILPIKEKADIAIKVNTYIKKNWIFYLKKQ